MGYTKDGLTPRKNSSISTQGGNAKQRAQWLMWAPDNNLGDSSDELGLLEVPYWV